jgi:hypothetical protein
MKMLETSPSSRGEKRFVRAESACVCTRVLNTGNLRYYAHTHDLQAPRRPMSRASALSAAQMPDPGITPSGNLCPANQLDEGSLSTSYADPPKLYA